MFLFLSYMGMLGRILGQLPALRSFQVSKGRKLDVHTPLLPRFNTRSVWWPQQLGVRPGVPRPVPAFGSSGPAPWTPLVAPCLPHYSKEELVVLGQLLERGVSSHFLMPSG